MKRGIIFLLIFVSLIALVSSLPVFPPTTCSQIWGGNCCEGPPESFDNTFDNCNYGAGYNDSTSINEIFVDKSALFVGNAITITCNVLLKDRMRDLAVSSNASTMDAAPAAANCRCNNPSHLSNKHCAGGSLYVYYKSPATDAWVRKYFQSPVITCENYSVSFIPDSVSGEHQARCVIGYDIPETPCPNTTYYDVDDVNFTVYSEFISITLSNTPINFGNVDMNTTKPALNNPLIISVDSNVNFDITTKANGDFRNDAGYIFPVSNMRWATSNVAARPVPYTLNESRVYSNRTSGNFTMLHYLSIPVGQRAGTYSTEVVITAKKYV